MKTNEWSFLSRCLYTCLYMLDRFPDTGETLVKSLLTFYFTQNAVNSLLQNPKFICMFVAQSHQNDWTDYAKIWHRDRLAWNNTIMYNARGIYRFLTCCFVNISNSASRISFCASSLVLGFLALTCRQHNNTVVYMDSS